MNLRLVILIAAVSAVVLPVPVASAGPAISEFPLDPSSSPTGITAGPDGHLWIAQQTSPGRVTRLTTSGTAATFAGAVTPDFAKDKLPTAITTGPDGMLWLAMAGGNLVQRITTAGQFTQFPLQSVSDTVDVAAGPDGALWFTSIGGADAIVRVATDGAVTEYRGGDGLTSESAPGGITAGPDGAMWFTESAAPGRIGRITTGGVVSEYVVPAVAGAPTPSPADITLGPDGALWFTDTGTNALWRLTTAGAFTRHPVGPGTLPQGITVGNDGALWFAGSGGIGFIGRMTMTGTLTQYTAGLSPNGAPWAITSGPDGAIWFTVKDAGTAGRISIPPTAGEATATATATTASLAGKVRPNGTGTSYRFEYGTSPDSLVSAGSRDAGAGAAAVSATTELSGLTPQTTFHYRLVATSDAGEAATSVGTFTTAAAPPPAAPVEDQDPSVEDQNPAVEDQNPPVEDQEPPVEDQDPPVEDKPALAPAPGAATGTPDDDDDEDDAPVDPSDSTDGGTTTTEPSRGPAAEPEPEIGRAVVVRERAGRVRVRLPGAAGFTELTAATGVPVGAVVDATRGQVELASALDRAGRAQSGRFRGGRFQVRQSSTGRGMTDIHLRGGSRRACVSSSAVRLATTSARRGRSAKTIRRLWSRDKGGRFRTHGQQSVATVRGTAWYTADTCAGTLTRVSEGSVLVRERRTGRRVLLRRGMAHLARRTR